MGDGHVSVGEGEWWGMWVLGRVDGRGVWMVRVGGLWWGLVGSVGGPPLGYRQKYCVFSK